MLNSPSAGSKSVLNPVVIPGTICWLEDVAFEISTLPPAVMVCALFCHVSTSSRLKVGAPRQLGVLDVNQFSEFPAMLIAWPP